VRLGISPCPNDTFAFHGLLTGAVRAPGLELEISLLDIEELNARIASGELDAAKASAFAALQSSADCALLRSGAAVGYGVGPLLLAAAGRGRIGPRSSVLCPGAHTTASLLYGLFHPEEGRVEQVVFSQILPRLERGEADFGVCIHEGRFTWEGRGLRLVEDLGASWEARARAPLPLGGVLARKSLGRERCARLAGAIRDSVDHGWAHRSEALVTMRAHAQESADEVLWKHVELYVTEETRELSERGKLALSLLERLAKERGLLAPSAPALEIWGD
jgi:5,8-dihydroxy-2-naphthoate synthase